MKLWEIFRFELEYQLRRWLTWLYFAIFLLLTGAMAMSFVDNVRNGDYLLNAPIVTGAIMSIASLLGLLVAAAVAGDAATHAMQQRMEPLLYTSPVSKLEYLGGRFLGAFTICLLVLLSVPIGLILAAILPGTDKTLFGPFELMSYTNAFLLVVVPTTFVTTAILFAAALLTRHALASFLVGTALFMGALSTKEILADHMGFWTVGKLLDLSTFTIFGELREALPTQILNTQPIGLDKWLLLNRAFWLIVGIAVLGFAYYRFRFAHYVSSSWWKRFFSKKPITVELTASAPIAVPQVRGVFTAYTRFYQVWHLAWRSFTENLGSWLWLAIVGLVILLLIIGPELLEGPLGVPKLPVTGRVTALFDFIGIKIAIVAILTLYAGQVVWRERDARMGDISDAAPVPDAVLLTGRLISIILLIVLLQSVTMLTGVVLQAQAGYFKFDLGLYLQMLFGLRFVDYLLFAILAIVVHVLVNQKYMGHMVVLLTFLFTMFAPELGIRHNLLIYGADSGWNYTALTGFGATLGPWLWFKLYWFGWATLLAVLAKLCWVRGHEIAFKQRLAQLLARPTGSLLVLAIVGCLVVCTTGAFVFYNTNVLNEYYTPKELVARRALYEQRYSNYKNALQPGLTAASLHVEIYPEQQRADINGTYTLKNNHNTPIDTIHLATAAEVQTNRISFSQQANPIVADKELRHFIYKLEQPLQPGDSLELDFEVRFKQEGFTNSGVQSAVTKSSTYFLGQEWLPAIGYQEGRELSNAAQRKTHDLPPKPETPSLYDKKARYNVAGRERIRFDAVIGTSADQLAVAPGNMNWSWVKNGRRYFHYTTDSPIRTLTPFFSAKYAVREDYWNDVQIRIYYHPEHSQNLNGMIKGIKASLAYYTKHLGPYPHNTLTFAEYPGGGSGASSYAATIAYTEGFALLDPEADYRDFDLVFAVVAHEIAHQWWAHQLIPAPVEGAPVLSESLAWYSALGVVEETFGKEHLQRLLYVMRDAYLSPRSKADVPLLRATDPFLKYRKGPFAMYMLRQYAGQEQVDIALRNLLQKHKTATPPLPTSLDLYQELKTATPDTLHTMLADLFERNTYWEVETKKAETKQLSNGKWELTLDVHARKEQADTAGVVTPMQMNDWIEIGAYAPAKAGYLGKQLYLKKHRIRSGVQRITLLLPGRPAEAGIDPNFLLIDTYPYDNLKQVKLLEKENYSSL